MIRPKYDIYPDLGYWFLSLIVLVFLGFYVTYFSVFFQPRPMLVHVHFTLMALWIAMLITQPFLIKYKKIALHKLIGKLSYVLVPLVLFTSFMVTRAEYYRHLGELEHAVDSALTRAEMLSKAADQPIALMYFTWFALFYVLAIINRRRSLIHSRFMLATSLTLIGPTVDRIIGINLKINVVLGFIPVYASSFLLIDTVLALLLYQDYKNKMPVKTLTLSLIIYLAGQCIYFLLPHMDCWPAVMAFIMKPAP